jgi:hypothetical protein
MSESVIYYFCAPIHSNVIKPKPTKSHNTIEVCGVQPSMQAVGTSKAASVCLKNITLPHYAALATFVVQVT